MKNKFFEAYLEAALWSSVDENGEPLDANYGISEIHDESIQKMKEDCEKFQKQNEQWLNEENCLTKINFEEQGGHDFWLTRNGHGCGFWEKSDWKEYPGMILTKSAKAFGECNLYVGDDGLIHCF